MNAQYVGTQAKLCELNPAHVHAWCYPHVLKLVISESCTSVESVSFINLLQNALLFSLQNHINE